MDRVKPVPDGYHTVTPCLTISGAERQLAFLETAFDARVLRRLNRPDGTIGHAEVQIGNSMIMLAEASEQWPVMPSSLYLYVDNCDQLYHAALKAGASSIMEPADMFYGDRHGGVVDPCGNTWWIATHIEDLTDDELERRERERREVPSPAS